MKHEIVGYQNNWKFHKDGGPFPFFGPYKEIPGFLSVSLIGVLPQPHYTTVEQYHHSLLYDGPSKIAAQDAQSEFERKIGGRFSTSHINEYGPVLLKDSFRLVQLEETGQIVVINGEDKSDRCFLMGECNSSYTKNPRLVTELTTGRVLGQCGVDGDVIGNKVLFLALLNKGERIVFESSEKNFDGEWIKEFVWDSQYVNEKHTQRFEWEQENNGIAVVEGLASIGGAATKL
ncbi:MAG: hypothetical protein HY226_02835 [Candidatus Vogelbacteria bacterium]|nr:hypothetical protein [Candidatus Vogelbacteria bacterium]